MNHAAVLGPGRIGRQIALAFALGGSRVSLVDVKDRPAGGAAAVFTDARREIRRDLTLMAEEGVIEPGEIAPALARIEDQIGLEGLDDCAYVQEALPELLDHQREVARDLAPRVGQPPLAVGDRAVLEIHQHDPAAAERERERDLAPDAPGAEDGDGVAHVASRP